MLSDQVDEVPYSLPASPTLGKLDNFTKVELGLVAKVFKIPVPPGANKAVLQRCVEEKLTERGLMQVVSGEQASAVRPTGSVGTAPHSPAYSGRGDGGASSSPPDVDSMVSHAIARGDSQSLELAIQMRQLEFDTKVKEVEALKLRIRAIECEVFYPPAQSTASSRSWEFVHRESDRLRYR